MSPQKLFKAAGLIVLALMAQISFAQDRVITGKVTDSKDGSPLQGATVAAKGSGSGAQTGSDGTFRISVPSTVNALIVSSVGFATKEVSIEGKNSIEVALVITNTSMDEVVVVSYGTRRKSDLTGSVTSVSAKDFQKGNINSPEQLLQGKVAGLQITTGGGSAGGGSRIRIRGGASLNASNDPLIVIDGVPVEGNGIAGSANVLNSINPNDIESISVLKDASATALYGSRASNGVLIVTTKKGVKGKLRFNYNNLFSVGTVGKTVEVLTAGQVTDIINSDAAETGNNTYKNLLGSSNTNWQDEIYQSAFGIDNTISVSGGLGNVPFRASLGYLNQDGILKTNNFNRFSTALNLSPKLFENHLAVNLSVKASQTKNTFANEGAIGSSIAFDPTKPVLSGNKEWGGYYEWLQANNLPIDLSTRNPLGLLNLRDNTSKVGRVIGNVDLDYKLHFFPDLHIKMNFGLDYLSGSGNDNIDSVSATNYKTGGRKTFYEQKKVNTLADIFLFYEKNIKSIDSKIDVLVGHSYQDFLTKVYNYPSFSYRAIADPNNPAKKDTIQGSEPTFPDDNPRFRLESYLARVNFSIMNKYLITASIRSDASSKLNPNDRVGYFPAVAFAWKLKDEFFKNANVLNELKLRLGWGQTGNQDGIGYYSYLPRYSLGTNTAQYQFGNSFVSYLRPEGYDPNLKWETTTTSNIGLDFGILRSRITGSVDYYYRKTEDLLADVDVPAGANFVNRITTNVGNVISKGVEINLNTTPIKTENLTWDLGINYTYNEAEITNLLKNPDPNFKGQQVSGISGGTGNFVGIHAVNYTPFTYLVYKQIYDDNNKPIEGLYEDVNRDGIINDDDRYFYKKPAADVLLGLNTQVTYKDFSIGIAGHGSFGNYLYNNFFSNNGVLRSIKNPINFIGNASVDYLNTRFVNNQYLSDYYIENASFFRLDNINLGYNVGRVFNDKASLRVAASIQNVFVISKYKGLDPENAGDGGVDNNIYPRPRIFSLGFNFDF
ncbi:MAG: SusC/RagA family TonB-linked outer membrane protein [Chitinophagaceae bacterium]|nr:SusC/RagA family TonB-linked outer membrane protein [Chitinophagaceae bacterium]HQZ74048.1 SusC/RagA family TonB-linked outer membrane protein [Chitinophagaceae bacterium]